MSTHLRLTVAGEPAMLGAQGRRGYERLLTRAIDLSGAISLLCLFSPLLLFIVLLITVTDGLPIIYLRRVVGPDGEFDAYKFRTMCRNADAILEASPELREAFNQNFKLQCDPRITRI